jgi:5-amino-6-(5-phosphoribosylamino)uracil reductase
MDVPKRPYTTVVLAMSVDGKIADAARSPARFGSRVDKSHLETQIAQADGVLFGAGTLRAYGTTLRVSSPLLLQKRQQQGKPAQPIHIVCSQSASLDPHLSFFRQAVTRWLLTTTAGATHWQQRPEFERVLVFADQAHNGSKIIGTKQAVDWFQTLGQLIELGIERLVITGGSEIVAALLADDLIDEFWLTVCPLILGGAAAPTPVGGQGFAESLAPRLKLLSAEVIGQEVFLHYHRQR